MKTNPIKKIFGLLLVAMLAVLPLAIAGCKKEDPSPTYYTVTFDADNGTTNTTVQVEENKKVTAPTAPTKAGFAFDGWFNNLTEWNFETDVVTSNLTLKAHWTDVRVPVFTTQPTDLEVSYPKGGSLSVEVENPELVESYQWQEWMKGYGDEAVWRNMYGISAATSTLQLKSTLYNYSSNKFRCVVTNTNGKTAISDVANIVVNNKNEFVPCVRIGEYAVEPGQTLDLSTTINGSGKISMEKVSDDRYDITLDRVYFDNEKTLASDIFASVGLELLSEKNTANYYYIHLIGDNTFVNHLYDPDLNAAGIPICCNWLSAATKPTIIFDGTGLLTINGGTELIYSNSAIEVNCNMNLISTKDVYGNGIKCNNLLIKNGATIQANLNGSLAILNSTGTRGNIIIRDNSVVTANISLGRVGVGLTTIGLLRSHHSILVQDSVLSMDITTDPNRFIPTNQGVGECKAIVAPNVVLFYNSVVKIKMSADEGSQEYFVENYTGIEGNYVSFENSTLNLEINSNVIYNTQGILSNESFSLAKESNVNIYVKSIGATYGVQSFSNSPEAICCENSKMKVVVDSYEENPEEPVYGLVCKKTGGIDLINSNVDVTCEKGPAIVVYLETVTDPVEYDERYVPKNTALILTDCEITTPSDAVKNVCGASNGNKFAKLETIYDANDKTTPAHHVVISQTKIKDE